MNMMDTLIATVCVCICAVKIESIFNLGYELDFNSLVQPQKFEGQYVSLKLMKSYNIWTATRCQLWNTCNNVMHLDS